MTDTEHSTTFGSNEVVNVIKNVTKLTSQKFPVLGFPQAKF